MKFCNSQIIGLGLIFCLAATLTAEADLVLWNTSFTDNSGGLNTNRQVNNNGWAGVNSTASWALTRSGSGSPVFLTGANNGANNFNPNQNVDNAANAFWQGDFSFTGTGIFEFSSIDFDIYRYNNSGAMQTSDNTVRSVDFSSFYTVNGGATWNQIGSTQNVNTTLSNTSSPSNIYINLLFSLNSPISVNLASNQFAIRFRAANDNTIAGANIGINNFNVNSAIPEPSAVPVLTFGLAGLAGRRRRGVDRTGQQPEKRTFLCRS
jgi:hypothetical protein